jgi:drug/metabolite transporter (DMT)-like permease
MTYTSRAHIAVLFTNLFFAANYSFIKLISPSHVGPYGLNVIRVAISLLLFWLIWIPSGSSPAIQKKHIPRFILCGLTGIAINQMLFIKGLTLTSTIHASLLMLCTPLLITLFAFWVLRENITVYKIAGIALGIAGAIWLVYSKESGTSESTSSLNGDILIILNAISYTIYFILVKPLMKEYPPLQVMRWVFAFGLVLMLPLGWTQFTQVNWPAFEMKHILALVFIVFCGSFLAYYFNAIGLQVLGAGITGSYIYTQPVFAAIIAMFVLNEHFTWEKAGAGALIFLGVFLVSRK